MSAAPTPEMRMTAGIQAVIAESDRLLLRLATLGALCAWTIALIEGAI